MGKYYQDNADPTYSQAAGYTYDGVNRLMTAVATGNSPFNLTYNYDQYGNGTCVLNGSTQGFCPQYSYNSANDHITNTGFNYDPAGDLLWDGGSHYEYDAEGRVKHSYSTGQWQYPMYNALGQRVQDYQGIDPMTLTYPRDIFGQRTGTFAQWPSQNWTGWNVYWSQIAGQRLNMGGASAYIDHADAVGSTTMETDPAGGVQWKIAYYPWGQVLAQGGIRQSVVWAGLDWQVNDPSYPSATREYNDGLARWLTPDPGGVKVFKLDDPQTWNMYAYVTNNHTTLNDPGGLQSDCATGPDGGGCSSNGESFEESTMHFSDGRYGLEEITDLGIGMTKGLLNMLISIVNVQVAMDPELHGVPLPEFQATDAMQKVGMVTAAVGGLFVPGAEEGAAEEGLGEIEVLSRDVTGKIHSDIPSHIPSNWTKKDLEHIEGELMQSVKVRNAEQIRYGEEGGHRERIRRELKLLRQIQKMLSGS
ncbi:MAG TPA: RHS repeat-associated core domain-containing protein [Terriglobia bacterium]|nr:RHS repeat-associated core domain-containing protein [Terriglobia bacterium]